MAIVTVARECGSGGEDIAKAVAEPPFAVGVIVVGKLLLKRKKAAAEELPAVSEQIPVKEEK